MDTLTVDAAEEIAKHLLDEQDIAALQQTCRFWRGVYSSGELWRALLELRFGPHAAEEADRGEAQAAFRRLAELQVPVATDASVAWLGSNYVEGGSRRGVLLVALGCTSAACLRLLLCCAATRWDRRPLLPPPAASWPTARSPAHRPAAVGVPGTAAGQAVRVNAVCWLALSYTFPGVLPGAYQARCRLRCQPHFFTDELIIDAVPAAGCGSPASRTYSLQELRDASVSEGKAGTDYCGLDV